MKLLEAEPSAAPAGPPEPVVPEPAAPALAARACSSCDAPLQPGQEWCLQCGAAAVPVTERAGRRPVLTVLGLTAVLVAGAVAAGSAALTDDAANRPAPGPVAQAPPAATPDAAAPATPAPAPAQQQPSGDADEGLPKVSAGKGGGATTNPLTPAPKPSATTPAPAPSAGPGNGTDSTESEQQAAPRATPAPTKDPAPEPIELAAGAGTIYDPYERATESSDASRALDGKVGTSWIVEAKGPERVNVGYAVDVGKRRGVRELQIATRTPGFRVEVYATDEAELPPDILDTRWSHIVDRADVGADGRERIVLGAGTSKYRNVLLWITVAPADGPRVAISELTVLG